MVDPSQLTVQHQNFPVSATSRGELHRGLKVLGTLLITLSAISPASSVFIIAPSVIGLAGTGALWAFTIAAVVGVFMALVYAELASAFPLAGGEYAIIARTLGPLPGFMILALMVITQILIIAVIALGVGTYLGVLFPNLNGPVVAAGAVAIGSVLAICDIKLNAVLTGTFLSIEMLALLTLTLLGYLHVERSVTDMLLHPVVPGSGGLQPATLGLIGIATSIAIFAYNGYGGAVCFGEETLDANRNIARAILWALLITVVAELVPVTAVLMGAPDLPVLFSSPNMFGYFLQLRGGDLLNTAVALAIALAIFNAVIAIILLTSRIIYSSGRDRTWFPFINDAFTTTHPRFKTPWCATLFCGISGAVACFVDLNVLVVMTGTSLICIYIALCLAVIQGRRNGTTAHAAYKMPLYPVPAVLAILMTAYVALLNAADPTLGRPSLIATTCILAVAVLYYGIFLRRRGSWGREEI